MFAWPGNAPAVSLRLAEDTSLFVTTETSQNIEDSAIAITKIDLDDEVHDIGDDFDPATNFYTAPEPGVYEIEGKITVENASGQAVRGYIVLNNADVVGYAEIAPSSDDPTWLFLQARLDLVAGDTIALGLQHSGADTTIDTVIGANETNMAIKRRF